MKRFLSLIIIFSVALASCRTAHFDKTTDTVRVKEKRLSKKELIAQERERLEYEIEEELKETDLEQTYIYVDRPVYTPTDKPVPVLDGQDAVVDSNKNSIQIPMRYVNGIMYYAWDDSFVFEIHTTPYRTTDLMLEPGEMVLEMPFLSEEKVWEIGAGVSEEKGRDIQHFFIKPAFANLTTSMIIITDRRVYHLLLKSFRQPASNAPGPERYMPMVKFNYPPSVPFTLIQDKIQKQSDDLNKLAFGTNLVDPRFLSFDYKMSYSIFKKPSWLPERVYDDGRKTYIVMDRGVLHAESPVLFNSRNQRINYRVHENMIVIDELVEKITLRSAKDKVTIRKKKFAGPAPKESED